MLTANLPADAKSKIIVRQESDYEAAGLDGRRTIPLPFTLDCINEEAIMRLGFQPAGVVRTLNQAFAENLGNIYGANVRKAVAKQFPLPTIADMDALIAAYDFSGVRASSEAGMPEEERSFRTHLRKQLRSLLRGGTFSATGAPLTVQTKVEADKEELPDNKMSIEAFESLVEAAAEGVEFQFDGLSFDFAGEPAFDEEGNFANFAAITAFAHQLADEDMALRRRAVGRTITASIPRTSADEPQQG